MNTIKRILVPTDLSASSKKALDYALSIAELIRAEVIVLNVIETSTSISLDGSYLSELTQMKLAAKRMARALITSHWAQEPNVNPVAEIMVVSGSPFKEIVQIAEKNDVDLIVIGTHGRSVVRHWLFGSVAERVFHDASCPVLTVKLDENETIRKRPQSQIALERTTPNKSEPV